MPGTTYHYWGNKDHKLTGRIKFRLGYEKTGWFKNRPILILVVEETYQCYYGFNQDKEHTMVQWRDLRTTDLILPEKDK